MNSDRYAQALVQRWDKLPVPAGNEGLTLRRGSLKDYAQLCEHHYKADRPATATRVLVLECGEPSVVDRFVHAGATPNEKGGLVAGVLVESLPSLSCRMRDYALGNRYGGWKDVHQRAALLNSELRCISRVVVHPQWRGMGLAVRLVKAALAEPVTMFTEALAAMGKVNPFFERAGMRAYPRPTHEFDARLVAALRQVGFEPVDLAMQAAMWDRIERLPLAHRQWLLLELHRWYRRNHGRAARYNPDPKVQLEVARGRLLCEPVYYLHDNRAGA